MESSAKEIVGRYYKEVLNQGKYGLVDELFDRNFKSHLVNGLSINLEQYRNFIAASFSALQDIQVTIEDQIEENDKVSTRWSAKGKLIKPFAGISEVGKMVTVSAIHIHWLKDGKITDHWEAINLHAIKVE